jgi:hypothetical protein
MNLGYCVSSWIGYAFFFDVRGEDSWRGPFGVQVLISLILLIGTLVFTSAVRTLV